MAIEGSMLSEVSLTKKDSKIGSQTWLTEQGDIEEVGRDDIGLLVVRYSDCIKTISVTLFTHSVSPSTEPGRSAEHCRQVWPNNWNK